MVELIYELEVAKEIVKEVWEKISPIYDGQVEYEDKEDGTPVTKADKLANYMIISKLNERFPGDSIVSEEDKNIILGERTWYIDPIDGTRGFIKRNGQFAIQIGLCIKSMPVLGVVYWAVTGDLYYGVKGFGAWRENARGVSKLKISNSREDLIAMTNDKIVPEDLSIIFEKLDIKEKHALGSDGLRIVKIAENIVDFRVNESLKGPSTWDICAPHAIIESAGGAMKYLDGRSILYERQGKINGRYVAGRNLELVNKIIEVYKNQN